MLLPLILLLPAAYRVNPGGEDPCALKRARHVLYSAEGPGLPGVAGGDAG